MSKRHLVSMYFEIDAEDPAEAEKISADVLENISEWYPISKTSNFRIGGTALIIPGDLIGNAERAEKI